MFIKHSKENTEENFYVLGIGEDFLYRIQKAITTSGKKIKKFILIKATSQKAYIMLRRWICKPHTGRKYLSDKELAYSTYK